MRLGRYVPIPEGPGDLKRLWETSARLAPGRLPAWLGEDDHDEYRLVASLSLAGLSHADRQDAEAELEACELARLVVDDEDPDDEQRRRVYVAAPRPEQLWSIGVVAGIAPGEAAGPVGAAVLTAAHVTDVPASSVADPFLLHRDGRWWMFFEVVNWKSWKGEIGLASSGDGRAWHYERIVLTEAFHLSYPYVFEDGDAVYMVPETSQAGAVRLYRARRFPWEWEHVADLLRGMPFADTSVIRAGDGWWLFTETSGGGNDTLRLFHADHLHGPWHEHPRSPIVSGDPTIARPAGRIVSSAGRLVRFAQNCLPAYGTDVRAIEIVRLTREDYAERACRDTPVLGTTATDWNAGGMHHIDPVRLPDGDWLAAVDGWRWEPDRTDGPAPGPLLAGLRSLGAAQAVPFDATCIVDRRPNEYASSAPTEIVTLGLPDGARRELFVKYGGGADDAVPRYRHGVAYCAAVQRRLVERLPLPHVAALGLVHVGDPPVPALVSEYLAGALRVAEAPDDSGMVAAAEWCGRLHTWGQEARQDPGLAFLVRYDLDFYRAWGDRALSLARAAGGAPGWLERICATWRDRAAALADAIPTVIHGEFGAQNVLWRDGVIRPVDWESAAIGAGEIDLATLLLGWPARTAETCIAAYWRARGVQPPSDFRAVWTAAMLYTGLRWLAPPGAGDHRAFTRSLRLLEETAATLSLEP